MTAIAASFNDRHHPARKLTDPRLRGLPAEAVARFEYLRQVQSRAAAMRNGLDAQKQEIRDELRQAEASLAIFDSEAERHYTYLENDDGSRRRVPVVPKARVALVERIAALREEVSRLETEISLCNVGFACDDILSWLARDVPDDAKFRALPAPKLVIPPGKALTDLLEANKVQQADLVEEIEALKQANLPAAEAKSAMRAQIEALAERGRPQGFLLQEGAALYFPTTTIVGGSHGAQDQHFATIVEVSDALAITAWACKEQIIAKLEAEIDRTADDRSAVTAADRPRLLAAAHVRLLQLRHLAEAIITRIEKTTGAFVKRQCASPVVLLSIDDGSLAVRH
jgi:hypothetical protein